ncbi:putative Histidine kinase [Desulfamplus magnetovallimortis]|uniref:histidine kinase n=1 Tax=Desulfamplus magnetovallimortis TaxID=1246637 RepID=A0A1W1HDQ3_9BACT|nr:PAS domain-containing protein [Desulfamplus magnetovallimortis]SLM30563.1 putative Histidine kinase [Desulfamplus magnetovallimortis]
MEQSSKYDVELLQRRVAQLEEAEKRRINSEKREQHIKQVLLSIRNVNQIILRENNPDRLIELVCSTLKHDRGYHNSWIALINSSDNSVYKTAYSGFNSEFKLMEEKLAANIFTECMTKSLLSGETVVIEEPLLECKDCPLAQYYGGRSGFSRKISYDNSVYGIISVSVPSYYAHDKEELKLFGDLSNNLGFAFSKMEKDKKIHKLNYAIQSIPHPIALLSDKYEYETVNRTYCDYYKIPENKIIGRTPEYFFGKEMFYDVIKPEIDKCLAGNKVYYERIITFPHDDKKWMAMTYFPDIDEDGKITGIISNGIDITSQKNTEEALRQRKNELKLTLDATTDAIWSWNFKTNELFFSPRYYTMLGYSPNAFPADYENWLNLIHPEDRESAVATATKYLKTKPDLYENEFRLKTEQGTYRWIHAKARVAERDKDGNAVYMIGNHEDITERKKAEQENLKLEKQIQQSQKMEAIGTLSGGIAHDFNNILFPIMGYTEMMLNDVDDDSDFKESLKQIYSASMRAKELVQQILTFSRQTNSELQLIRMQYIAKEVLKLIRHSIPATIEIRHNINSKCPPIYADPTQIHQIIMNLTTNAYHAMEDRGGELSVALQDIDLSDSDIFDPDMKPGKYACLSVGDTGTGIPKEIKHKIFDPFFTTKKEGKGTGMGLSVVHGIMKNIGGGIYVYSEPGQGTEFKLYFPVAEEYIKENIPQIDGSKFIIGTEKILLVDDEEFIIDIETKMLNRIGYHVTSRTSSIEALELFKSDPDRFDLIISDMAMPKLPGDKLARELLKIRPDIPIILCTGFSEKMSDEKAKLMGIKGFLLKPVVMTALSKKIREVLD